MIDAPPLLPVADASGLAVLVDGVVLSVRYGSTRQDQLEQARATLDRVGARTLGVVLNIVPPKAEVTSAYGYGFSYGYDSDRGGKSD
jgi:Mrp family chromosome partitioning ATPase